MVLDFKVNARLVVGMTINFFLHLSRPHHSRPTHPDDTRQLTQDLGEKKFPAIADRKSFGASANVMRR